MGRKKKEVVVENKVPKKRGRPRKTVEETPTTKKKKATKTKVKKEVKTTKKETKPSKKVVSKSVKKKKLNPKTKFKLKINRDMLPFLTEKQKDIVCTSNESAIEFIRSNKKLADWQKDAIYNEMIKANYWLVLGIVKKLYEQFGFLISREDLLSAGNYGFGKALKAYNPEISTAKFSSFATSCITNECRYACRTADRFYNREESLDTPTSWDKDGQIKTYNDVFAAPPVENFKEFDNTPFHKFVNNRLSFLEKYTLFNYNEIKNNTYLTQKQMSLLLEYPKSYLTSKHAQAKNKIKEEYYGSVTPQEKEYEYNKLNKENASNQ